jgi:propanediol utilization protein
LLGGRKNHLSPGLSLHPNNLISLLRGCWSGSRHYHLTPRLSLVLRDTHKHLSAIITSYNLHDLLLPVSVRYSHELRLSLPRSD